MYCVRVSLWSRLIVYRVVLRFNTALYTVSFYIPIPCVRCIQWCSQELDLGVYVLTSHCNFKTCVNVLHVNKTVIDIGGIYTDIPPVATVSEIFSVKE